MGKWIATDHYHDGRWMIMKEGGKDVGSMTKDQATRYATALNVADAGVDLGEAVRLVKLMDLIIARCEAYGIAHTYATEIKSYLTRIANAVEGDKTKEDV